VSAFRVKLCANDLNCVDVPLNPTHSLLYCFDAVSWPIERVASGL